MKVRSITNISQRQVQVRTSEGGTIYLLPQQVSENVDVVNLATIKDDVQVIQDLGEPVMESPVRKGKRSLNEVPSRPS